MHNLKFSPMKLLKYSLLIPVVLSTSLPFSSCKKKEELVACHQVVNPIGLINDPIYLVNCSKGAESFIWDFGDGSNSSEFEPIHRYNTKGVYHTDVKVIDEEGNSMSSRKQDVVIYDSTLPTGLIIHEIIATYYSSFNDPWDADGSGPDISVAVEINNFTSNETFFKTDYRYTDCESGKGYLFNASYGGLPVNIDNLNQDYTFVLYDYDGDEENHHRSEYPVGSGILEAYKSGLEPKQTIKLEGYKVDVELKVTWVY